VKGDLARGENIDTSEIEKVLLEYIEWLYEELLKTGKKQ